MSINSELNRIFIAGDFSSESSLRLQAAMHNLTNNSGFKDLTLDFSNCSRAFPSEMLPICARAQLYWRTGIDISLILPNEEALRRLFLNTNWAHLIDIRSFEPSRYRGYTHAPAIKFSNGKEQNIAVDKLLDILLAAISHFKRDDIRYIEWAINEVTDNVINHSNSEIGGFVQITNHSQRKMIEFVVCDCGIGIPASLRSANLEIRNDIEALDAAIREGVTRDKNLGQGNGLYGTLRISQKSKGEFQINSGYGHLTSSEKNGLHIKKASIPLNGTTVVAKMGYSDKVNLSDALVFDGKKHIPLDYIALHFDEDEAGNVFFIMKDESDGFGTRSAGEPVRRKLKNIAESLSGGKIYIDFIDVPLISSSFADEVVGKLFKELGPIKFVASFEFKNLDPLVKDLIDRAVLQRMGQ